MVFVEWHLIYVTKDAPVDEVTHKACQSRNPVALNLIESQVDVLRGDLVCSIMQRRAE